MNGAIYIFAAEDGDLLPRLVAQAELVDGEIRCADPYHRAWLSAAVVQVARGAAVPTGGPELDQFLEAVCDRCAGTRLFASRTPVWT